MRIARLAFVFLATSVDAAKEAQVLRPDDVDIIGVTPQEGTLRFLLKAEVNCEPPIVDSSGFVAIPIETRELDERIETAANLLSISANCGRTIRAPVPSLMLKATSDADTAVLAKAKGFRTSSNGYVSSPHRLSDEVCRELLKDRRDGMALMSEALSHSHPTGRFHELFRLYERAFRTACNQLTQPLGDFLSGHPDFGYSHKEIDSWINVRGPATHADRRPTFLLEADTRPLLHRMEQAAWDVLCNKDNWRTPCSARRKLWRPSAGSTSANGIDVFLVQGHEAKISFEMLEDCGRYLIDLNGFLKAPPEGYWIPQQSGLTLPT